MPPSTQDRLRDIHEAIVEIEDLLNGYTLDRFVAERRTRLLIERLLEIVCEASRALPEQIKRNEAAIAWQKMVDFGNLLRHAYHSTRAEIVWDVISNDLPPLKSVVVRRIRESD